MCLLDKKLSDLTFEELEQSMDEHKRLNTLPYDKLLMAKEAVRNLYKKEANAAR